LWLARSRSPARRRRTPLLEAGFAQTQPQISPDGRWLAYISNESGLYEVYVRPYPMGAGKWQISQGGGQHHRWRGDSKELYYYAPDGRLMAASIGGGAALEAGTPVPLFEAHMMNGPVVTTGFRAQYDVTRDGRRFLLNVPLEGELTAPVSVVLDWIAGLR
jgi:hypothetical protein